MELTDNQARLLRNCTNAVANTENLTETERDLLFYLALGADKNGVCKRTLAFLARAINYEESQVKNAINGLNGKGRLFSLSTSQRRGVCYTHVILNLNHPVIPGWLTQIATQKVRQYLLDGLLGSWLTLPGSPLSASERILSMDLRRRVLGLRNESIFHPVLSVDWITHPVLRAETLRDIAGSAKPHTYPRIYSTKQYASLSFKEKEYWSNLWS